MYIYVITSQKGPPPHIYPPSHTYPPSLTYPPSHTYPSSHTCPPPHTYPSSHTYPPSHTHPPSLTHLHTTLTGISEEVLRYPVWTADILQCKHTHSSLRGCSLWHWALARCCKCWATSTWAPLGAHNEVTHEGHNHRTSLLLILPQSVDEREASMFVQVLVCRR